MSSSIRSTFINVEMTLFLLRLVGRGRYLRILESQMGRKFVDGWPSAERLKIRHGVMVTVF